MGLAVLEPVAEIPLSWNYDEAFSRHRGLISNSEQRHSPVLPV